MYITWKLEFLNVILTLFQSNVTGPAAAVTGVDAPDGVFATEETGVESLFDPADLESRRFTILIDFNLYYFSFH